MTAPQADPNAVLAAGFETGGVDDVQTIERVEERLTLSKRRVAAGTVRVATLTEVHEDVAEVELDRDRVEVTHVPVGRVVDVAPASRVEGDTTIVPVVEERLVVVRQLFLKEEVHIRRVTEREVARETVPLRRQRVVVERRDAEGRLVSDPEAG